MQVEPVENFPIDDDSQAVIDYMYQIIPTTMTLPDGTITEVPESGNIGLLASGYKGIIAWRKRREEVHGSRFFSPFMEGLEKLKRAEDKNDE